MSLSVPATRRSAATGPRRECHRTSLLSPRSRPPFRNSFACAVNAHAFLITFHFVVVVIFHSHLFCKIEVKPVIRVSNEMAQALEDPDPADLRDYSSWSH